MCDGGSQGADLARRFSRSHKRRVLTAHPGLWLAHDITHFWRCCRGEQWHYESDAHKRENSGSQRYGCEGTSKLCDLKGWRVNRGYKEESNARGGKRCLCEVRVRDESNYYDQRCWHKGRGCEDESAGHNQKGLHKSREQETKGWRVSRGYEEESHDQKGLHVSYSHEPRVPGGKHGP